MEYFLGGFTPKGFKNRIDTVFSQKKYFVYIIKGVSGKESLLRAMLLHMPGSDIYYGAMGEIAGIIDEKHGNVILDGDFPYAILPKYPLVRYETINLDDYVHNSDLNSHKEAILYSFDEYYKYTARVPRYLRAVEDVCEGIYQSAKVGIDYEKIDAYINRLSKKIFAAHYGFNSSVLYKQFSSLTPTGYKTLTENFQNYTVYTVLDDNFAGSNYLLGKLAEIAQNRGYTVVLSMCDIFSGDVGDIGDVIEHLVLPELKIAFLTSNFVTKLDIPTKKHNESKDKNDDKTKKQEKSDKQEKSESTIINFRRFYDKETLSKRKNRMTFDKKSALALLSEASNSLDTATKINAKIKQFYSSATDEVIIDTLTKDLIEEL